MNSTDLLLGIGEKREIMGLKYKTILINKNDNLLCNLH